MLWRVHLSAISFVWLGGLFLWGTGASNAFCPCELLGHGLNMRASFLLLRQAEKWMRRLGSPVALRANILQFPMALQWIGTNCSPCTAFTWAQSSGVSRSTHQGLGAMSWSSLSYLAGFLTLLDLLPEAVEVQERWPTSAQRNKFSGMFLIKQLLLNSEIEMWWLHSPGCWCFLCVQQEGRRGSCSLPTTPFVFVSHGKIMNPWQQGHQKPLGLLEGLCGVFFFFGSCYSFSVHHSKADQLIAQVADEKACTFHQQIWDLTRIQIGVWFRNMLLYFANSAPSHISVLYFSGKYLSGDFHFISIMLELFCWNELIVF